jgi:2-dehydro-3-deoxygalactonokinase
MSAPRVIAVDWGTSRLRAYLVDAGGRVLDRLSSDDGIATVPPGGFADVLERHCGHWMARAPAAPVVMAGMVGSRNGWAEAAYAPCPASPQSIAAARLFVSERVSIMPGVIARGAGGPEVMRGEETLIFGTGIADGLVCLPGTHSKWCKVERGAIVDFATFMTGESYGLYLKHSLLGRLASEPADPAGFDEGLAAARDSTGLLNRLFQARARVLDGALTEAKVGPFLSGLLIGSEVAGALCRYGETDRIVLVADGVLVAHYGAALESRGATVESVAPEAAFLAGLSALVRAGQEKAKQ